jgi:Mrp family chromosome partitioning ATPase
MFDALRRAEAERKRKTEDGAAASTLERADGPRLETVAEAHPRGTGASAVPVHEVRGHPEGALEGERLREMGILRNSLEAKLGEQAKRVLLFTSAMHDEGVTTLAVAYSQLLAMHGHRRVLLVELNARRPALAERLGLAAGAGVTHYFRDPRPLASVVQRVPAHGFDALHVGEPDPTQVQIHLEKLFPRLRDEALRVYDAVVIDAPPVVLAPETPPIAPLVDGVVMVVWSRKTKRETVQRSIQLLRQFDGRVLGVVLNRKRYHIPEFIYRRL